MNCSPSALQQWIAICAGSPSTCHAGDLQPLSTQTDAVVLHLWQAVQVVIDLAVSSCVRLSLGSPSTYAADLRAFLAALREHAG